MRDFGLEMCEIFENEISHFNIFLFYLQRLPNDRHNCCDNHIVAVPDKEQERIIKEQQELYRKYRQLLHYDDAPHYLQFNPYIRKGYRTMLPSKLCWESIFWWTNETVSDTRCLIIKAFPRLNFSILQINIWSHIFGLFLFIALAVNDIAFLKIHAHFVDKLIVGGLLVCFQICMCLSSFYHIFCCRSHNDYECFLTYDLFGIALSLLGIYISGIYYAFWCHSVRILMSDFFKLNRINSNLILGPSKLLHCNDCRYFYDINDYATTTIKDKGHNKNFRVCFMGGIRCDPDTSLVSRNGRK